MLSYVVRIAWGNTFQNFVRTLAGLGGITFSILLVFLQLGFLNATKKEVTLLFEFFEFDAVIVSEDYQLVGTAGNFDRIRLFQAQVDPNVKEIYNLNVRSGEWVNPVNEISSSALVLGLDDKMDFIENDHLRDGLRAIVDGQSILLDEYSHSDYGVRETGVSGFLNEIEVNVMGTFQLGLFFYAEGAVATSNGNFSRMTGVPSNEVTMGLLDLKDDDEEEVEETVERLREALPDDVVVMSREELFDQEQGYFISVKPIGIMFRSAVFVAFAVGLVILFQVLSTELRNRQAEFSTMKAMGFSPSFIYGIGISQNLIFIIFSFGPAWLISLGIFYTVFTLSKLPMEMSLELTITVFGLTTAMSLIAGMLALRRVRQADPAELF